MMHLLTIYGYIVLFPLAVVEGPILAVIAGLLCAEGLMNPIIVYPVIVSGDLVGDSFVFMLGRWGNSRPLGRWARWRGLRAEKIEHARSYFDANPVRTVALSKLILGAGVAGIFLAGNSRVPYTKFIVICLVVSAIQYVFYLGAGILFGRAYVQINHYLNYIASISIMLALGLILFFTLKSLLKER